MIDIEKFKRTVTIRYGQVRSQHIDLLERLERARKEAVRKSGMFHDGVGVEELVGFTVTVNGKGECILYDASIGATTKYDTIANCIIDLIELDTTPDTNRPIIKTADQAVAIVNVAGTWFVFEADDEQIDYGYSEPLLIYTPLRDYKPDIRSPNGLGYINIERLLARNG